MRIALLSSVFYPDHVGGAELIAQCQADILKDAGHEVEIFCTVAQESQRMGNYHGCPVHYLGIENLYWPFDRQPHSLGQKLYWHWRDDHNTAMAATLEKRLQVFRPDILLTHSCLGLSTAIWARAKQLGIRVVHVLHDHSLLCVKTTMFHPRRGNCKRLCRLCACLTRKRRQATQYVDAVMSVSQYLWDQHRKFDLFGQAQHLVLHSPFLYPWPEETVPQNFMEDRLCLGFLGRVEKAKGIEILLEAAQAFPTRKLCLKVAGSAEPNYLAQLKQRFQDVDVSYLGKVNPKDLFDQIDVFVFPSIIREGLGNTVIESMVYGIPVIASHLGGAAELIPKEMGWYWEAPSVEALKILIQNVIENPELRKDFSQQLNQYRHRFSMVHYKNKYLEWIDCIES